VEAGKNISNVMVKFVNLMPFTLLNAPFVDRHALQDKARNDGSDYFIDGNGIILFSK